MHDPLDDIRRLRANSDPPDLAGLRDGTTGRYGAPRASQPTGRGRLFVAAAAVLVAVLGVAALAARAGGDEESDGARTVENGQDASDSEATDPARCGSDAPMETVRAVGREPVADGVDGYGEPQRPEVSLVVEVASLSEGAERVQVSISGETSLDIDIPAGGDCGLGPKVFNFGFAVPPGPAVVDVVTDHGNESVSIDVAASATWLVVYVGDDELPTTVEVAYERPEWG